MEYEKVIRNINKIIVTNLLVISLLTACHADDKTESANNTDQMASGTQVAAANNLITGVVKETMNAGGYTFISLEVNGEASRWIAGPKTEVAVGNTVRIAPPMEMHNFKSKALNREFETIYFTGKIFDGNGDTKISSMPHQSDTMSGTIPNSTQESMKAAAHSGMPAMAKSKTDPHAGVDMGGMEVGSEKSTTPNNHVFAETKKDEPIKGIKKVKNGKTISDVLKQKKDLDGKLVKIRGKVIKFTAEVMNKNWIHIKDSSTATDLTVTTSGKVEVGKTIIVDGKIAVNKDFGYGYIYDVILEEAKITIE